MNENENENEKKEGMRVREEATTLLLIVNIIMLFNVI